jgi:hypothetical protein
MAIRATRCVTHDHHPTGKQAVTDDPYFSVFMPRVFNLKRDASEEKSASVKSSPRSVNVLSRLAGSKVIRIWLLYLQ